MPMAYELASDTYYGLGIVTVTYCCSDAIVLVMPIVHVTLLFALLYCSLTVFKSGLLGTLEPQT